MLNEIFEIYSRQGESLIGIGIREAALPAPTAIDILNLFINERILVLGGDIYIKKDNYFYQTYDNWYYEGSNLFNSINKAMHYLSQIKLENAYVSFVLKFI
ncbi:hypothetical protein F9T62_002087 [Neisseria gonorrhoeae]